MPKKTKEIYEHVDELASLKLVQEAISQSHDRNSIIKTLAGKLREIFDPQGLSISSYDPETNSIEHSYQQKQGKVSASKKQQNPDIFTSSIIQSAEPLMFGNKDEILSYAAGDFTASAPPESLLGVPVIYDSKVKGIITFQDFEKENAFGERDLRLLSAIASIFAMALQNAGLLENNSRLLTENHKLQDETERSSAELTIINSIGEAMTRQLDIATITRIIGDKVRDIFHAEGIEILLLDRSTNMIRVPYSFYKNYAHVEPFPLGKGLTSRIIDSGKPLISNSEQEAVQYGAILDEDNEKTESYMGVPIIADEETLGVVSVQAVRKNAFNENGVRLLSIIAAKIGMALKNAKLFEETTRLLNETSQRNLELSLLNTIHQGMAMKMDFNGIIELVGDNLRESLKTDDISIRIYDKEKNLLYFLYDFEHGNRLHIEPSHPRGFSEYVIKTGQLFYLKQIDENYIRSLGIEMAIMPGTDCSKSVVVVPIKVDNEVHGLIFIENFEREDAFSESDLRLLETLANSMSIALENARLFNETKRLLNESEQRTAELSILNTIQQGLVMEMNFNSIINLVGNKLREALNFQDIGIRIYDKKTGLLHFPYEFERGERLNLDPLLLSEAAISGYVINSGKMLLLKKNDDEAIRELGLTGISTIPGTDRSKSLVAVPILVNNEPRGLILIENYEREDAYSASDIRLLQTLAGSMSIALENARLFEETKRLLNESEQRTAELSILNTIQQGLVMEMSFEGIINLVGDKLRQSLNYQDIGIRIYDKETGMYSYPYEYEHGVKLTIEPSAPGAISGWALKEKKMLHIRKNDDETLKALGVEGLSVMPGTDRSKSLVAIPIMRGDEVFGLFSIEDYEKEDAFSESDIRLFNTIASTMSIALKNARLFEETKRLLSESNKNEAELRAISNISQALTAHLELDKLINMVGDKIKELFKAEIVYLALLDRETNMINFPYGCGDEFPPMPFGEGLTSRIIQTGQPLLINRSIDEKRAELGVKRIGKPAASYLGVPIPVRENIIGVISIQSTEQENYFNDDDLYLLNTMAANIGVAINNAESYQKLNMTVGQLNKALNDLKSTQEQLIIQEKLASLGTLTAGIAHEIKNPLNFVNNFAEISIDMANELADELEKHKKGFSEGEFGIVMDLIEEIKENSRRINQHGKRADSIVRNMLLHSRGKTGEKQPTDINAMLDEDLNLAFHGMRARDASFNVSVEKEFDNSIGEISIVPQDISRVFINIINNGFYEVNRKNKDGKNNYRPTLWVTTKNLKDRIEIYIKDNGNGIPVEIQDKLFNPFFTTKPAGEGTGLGLSLSYDIVVKQHRGDISFESEPEKFTEFKITLPKLS